MTIPQPKLRIISVAALVVDVLVAAAMVTADLPFLVGGDISYVAWVLLIGLPLTVAGIVVTIIAGSRKGVNRVLAVVGGAVLLAPLALEIVAQTVGI